MSAQDRLGEPRNRRSTSDTEATHTSPEAQRGILLRERERGARTPSPWVADPVAGHQSEEHFDHDVSGTSTPRGDVCRKTVTFEEGLTSNPSLPRPEDSYQPHLPVHSFIASLFSTPDSSSTPSRDSSSSPDRRRFSFGLLDTEGPACDLPASRLLSGYQDGSINSIDSALSRSFLYNSPILPGGITSSVSTVRSSSQSLASSLNGPPGHGRPYSTSPLRNCLQPATDSAGLDSLLLEPCYNPGISGPMSEALLNASCTNNPRSINHSRMTTGRHETAYDGEGGEAFELERKGQFNGLLPASVDAFAHKIDVKRRHALRAASESSYTSSSCLPLYRSSQAAFLPCEVLHQVYLQLSPHDFHSARHTCRKWMIASLDRITLVTMIRRGGYVSGLSHRSTATLSKADIARSLLQYDPWTLSSFLARECALSAQWTGNGLPLQRQALPVPNAFHKAGHVDFQDLASGFAGKGVMQSSGLIFQVSVCGQYLLVGEGSIIYVYVLEGDTLRPLTSVICPRRVLAMSMDASSRRFAVAALLEGRMGIVCDLRIGKNEQGHICHLSGDGGSPSRPDSSSSGEHILRSYRLPRFGSTNTVAQQLNSRSVQAFEADVDQIEHSSPPAFDTIDVQSNDQHHRLDHTNLTDHHDRNWINQEWNFNLRSTKIRTVSRESLKGMWRGSDQFFSTDDKDGVPVDGGNRKIYRYLCGDDDPPRSVAICPQRRCVAFGCSAGIELHWVDALTGQDLNRWFPLTAPSDFLYFLPPRAGVDSPKKLRLISSAAHPQEKPALCRKINLGRSWLSPVSFEFDSIVGAQSPTSIPNYDHYRATPLGDGFHILFTDPCTGMLCLGTDAPLGGLTKLLRKMFFVPPTSLAQPIAHHKSQDCSRPLHEHRRTNPLVPRIYAASKELRLGPRVVCIYGDDLVLYTVPPDVFARSREEHSTNHGTGPAEADLSADTEPRASVDWLEWWPHLTCDAVSSQSASISVHSELTATWPLCIHGQHIGHVKGLVDVAISETPGGELSIWTFSLDGHATIWQLDIGQQSSDLIRKTVVGHDARVEHRFYEDQDGDATIADMNDRPNGAATPTAVAPEPPKGGMKRPVACLLDGHDSFLNAADSARRSTKPTSKPWMRLLPDVLCGDSYNTFALADSPGCTMCDAEGNVYISNIPLDDLDADGNDDTHAFEIMSS